MAPSSLHEPPMPLLTVLNLCVAWMLEWASGKQTADQTASSSCFITLFSVGKRQKKLKGIQQKLWSRTVQILKRCNKNVRDAVVFGKAQIWEKIVFDCYLSEALQWRNSVKWENHHKRPGQTRLDQTSLPDQTTRPKLIHNSGGNCEPKAQARAASCVL